MNKYIANVKRCSLVGRLLEQEILQWKSFVVVLSCFHQIEYMWEYLLSLWFSLLTCGGLSCCFYKALKWPSKPLVSTTYRKMLVFNMYYRENNILSHAVCPC